MIIVVAATNKLNKAISSIGITSSRMAVPNLDAATREVSRRKLLKLKVAKF
jgi:hypothetical protein